MQAMSFKPIVICTIPASYADGTPISDHFPVVVNFSVKDALHVNEPRYLRNVATGRFLNVGKYWDTHATLGEWGTKILLNELPDATYRLGTTLGSMSHNDNDPYMDTESTSAGTWNVNASGNASSFTYEENGTTYALTDEKNADAAATCTTYLGATNQQWEVLKCRCCGYLHDLFRSNQPAMGSADSREFA